MSLFGKVKRIINESNHTKILLEKDSDALKQYKKSKKSFEKGFGNLVVLRKGKYTGGYFDSPYTFNEGQFLDPDGLLDYLRKTNDHDLDIDAVEKVFKIGTYAELREEDNEEVA